MVRVVSLVVLREDCAKAGTAIRARIDADIKIRFKGWAGQNMARPHSRLNPHPAAAPPADP
jgi:hypothetical protein